MGKKRCARHGSGFREVRNTDPRSLPSSPGRDQSQALTAGGAQFRHAQLCAHGRLLFGEHGGGRALHLCCSFWEFGEPDWKHTKYFLLSVSRGPMPPIRSRLGLGKLKGRAPRLSRSIRLRPAIQRLPMNGSHQARNRWFCLSRADPLPAGRPEIDGNIFRAYTNAPWFGDENPGGADRRPPPAHASARRWFGTHWRKATKAGRSAATPALLGRFTCLMAAGGDESH